MDCKELESELIEFIRQNNTSTDESIFGALEDIIKEKQEEFYDLFNNLHEKSIEENYYWEHCSFKTYKETFQNRFKTYQIKFIDADLYDFIEIELSKVRECNFYQEEMKHPYTDDILQYEHSCFVYFDIDISVIIYNNLYEKIKQAYHKKIDFLTDMRLSKPIKDWSIQKVKPIQTNKSNIKFKGTQTEFMELVKALIENNSIEGTQIEIIEKLSNVFNIEINNPNKLIQDIKKRNNGSETLFLDKLKSSLLNYIESK